MSESGPLLADACAGQVSMTTTMILTLSDYMSANGHHALQLLKRASQEHYVDLSICNLQSKTDPASSKPAALCQPHRCWAMGKFGRRQYLVATCRLHGGRGTSGAVATSTGAEVGPKPAVFCARARTK